MSAADVVVTLDVDAEALAARHAAAEAELVLRVEHHCQAGLDLLREIVKARAALDADYEILFKRAGNANWTDESWASFEALKARNMALSNADHAIKTCGQGMRF